MKNQKQTIRKLMSYINNPETEGGFWLPNIQRPFVWNKEQICRLFDSIMREYPISTLLVWKTNSEIRRRKFVDNWRDDLKLSSFYMPIDSKKKCLVLDGQQRLQSLYIGLVGSYNGEELYFDILSGELASPDDVKFQFKFLAKEDAAFPMVRFKDIVSSNKKKRELLEEIKGRTGRELHEKEIDKIEDHIDIVERAFKSEETITYQELDSLDNPTLYTEDDVVEVFIRANSGGTKLGKSDLLFSLLSASWDVADEHMEELLGELNKHGFAFSRDFVLKTALTMLGHGAKYEVSKFRKPGVREEVENNWEKISDAIKDVLDFVRGKTYIQSDKALPSYLVLTPLMYVRYHSPKNWKKLKDVDTYLLRSSLSGAYGGQSDNLIDALVKSGIKDNFSLDDVFNIIRSQGRSLELTEERFWQMGYGSDTIHLLFNLWYRDFNHTPAYHNNLPQIDHIFPKSLLKTIKGVNSKTGRKDLVKYPEKMRNQLANCMLLSKAENGAGGKGDTPPMEWFADKDEDYLKMHLIPQDQDLWHIDRFDDFIEARKKLIKKKFSDLVLDKR